MLWIPYMHNKINESKEQGKEDNQTHKDRTHKFYRECGNCSPVPGTTKSARKAINCGFRDT